MSWACDVDLENLRMSSSGAADYVAYWVGQWEASRSD